MSQLSEDQIIMLLILQHGSIGNACNKWTQSSFDFSATESLAVASYISTHSSVLDISVTLVNDGDHGRYVSFAPMEEDAQ
jgi:hypothetical protein